jgi:hypothetical protein
VIQRLNLLSYVPQINKLVKEKIDNIVGRGASYAATSALAEAQSLARLGSIGALQEIVLYDAVPCARGSYRSCMPASNHRVMRAGNLYVTKCWTLHGLWRTLWPTQGPLLSAPRDKGQMYCQEGTAGAAWRNSGTSSTPSRLCWPREAPSHL